MCYIVLGVICLFFIPVYYTFILNKHFYPYWLSNLSSGMLFFVIGYKFRCFSPNKITIIILLAGYTCLMIFSPSVVNMRTGILEMGVFLFWAPTALMGIFTINGIFKLIFTKSNILSTIGSQTMPYYCMHWCVIVAVSVFFKNEPGSPNIYFLCTLLLANLLILPIVTYLIKKSRFSYLI